MTHIPILKDELIKYLSLKPGLTVVDMTVGLGGHAEAVLESIGKQGRLIALDLDTQNLNFAQKRLTKYQKQTFFFHSRFDHLESCLNQIGLNQVDRIYFDLGLSSPHVDEAARGFSFLSDGPLDMRYDPTNQTLNTAADLINHASEQELTKIFREYGEEKRVYKVSKAIIQNRRIKPINTTKELVNIILKILPWRPHKKHPATKIFQALRIAVNDELNVLSIALQKTFKLLKNNGRLAVISYHSLEDRIVKNFFRNLSKNCICPEENLKCQCGGHQKQLQILTKKPIIPSENEIQANPRSRSAKMRVGEKIGIRL